MRRRTFCRVAGLATGALAVPSFLARGAAQLAGVDGALAFGVQVASSPHFLAKELICDVKGLTEPAFTFASLQPGTTYYWRANVSKGLVTSSWSETFHFTTAAQVGTKTEDDGVPGTYELGQNYPNPFNPKTTIPFALPEAGHVSVRVFDMQGREVATLIDEFKTAGRYEVAWDARDLASGTYFCILQTSAFKTTRKMILLR